MAKTTDFLTLFEEEENNNDVDGVGGREDDEKNYDKDPELADILGTCLDDPDKAKSRVSIFFVNLYLYELGLFLLSPTYFVISWRRD